MTLAFEPVVMDKRSEYEARLRGCPVVASDYSLVNLWGWAEEYGLQWAWSDNLVWIRETLPESRLWAPVGDWDAVDWSRRFEELFDGETRFTRVPERLMGIWTQSLGDRIVVEEARGQWDYLYDVEELIQLRGKAFHKKKNLFNQFRKKYDFEYTPFGPDMIDMALGMQEDWCTWRDCESSEALSAENRVIPRVLKSWDTLPDLLGGAILVDGNMVAYTVAEPLAGDAVLIHFEKGSQDFKGVYQAINQMFLGNSGKAFKRVNREQDLDSPGLRKAKLSYNPVDYQKKFNVTLLPMNARNT